MKSIATLKPHEIDAARQKLATRISVAETGCHLLIGRGKNRDGYQFVCVGGVSFQAHRLAYELANGPINQERLAPGAWWVLHKCDTPNCCNPEHLYLGDASDNAKDRSSRCRMRTSYRPQCRWQTEDDIGVPIGTVYWEYKGQVKSLHDWAQEFNLHPSTLNQRFVAGWPEDSIPRRPKLGFRHFDVPPTTYRRFSGDAAAQQQLSSPPVPAVSSPVRLIEVPFTFRIPTELHTAAKAKAQSEHISLNSLIVRLLEREVAQKGKQ